MRVKVKRAGHEVARGHDRWHIDCVDAMTRPAGTRESTPEPTSDSLGSAWRRAGQRQELRDGRVFGVRQSSRRRRVLRTFGVRKRTDATHATHVPRG